MFYTMVQRALLGNWYRRIHI